MISNFLSMARRAASRDAQIRYVARHEILHRVAYRGGYRVYNKNLSWHDDSDYLNAWRRFPESTNDVFDRRFVLWSLARSVGHIAGHTAECGVNAGAGSFLIASAIGDRHHGFDSFRGLSAPGSSDMPTDSRARPWKTGDLAVGLERVRRNLAGLDVELYEGWIPERFDEVARLRFRLVHVDVDLYEPTRDAVEFFWPRINPGGLLINDDYGSTLCPGATQAMDELARRQGMSVLHLPTGQGILVKPPELDSSS